jgi:hypothetical protein
VLETAAEEAEPPAAEQLNLFSVIAARALTPDGSELGAKVWWDDEETHAQEDAWQPAEEEPELEVAPVPLPETSGPAPGASPPRSARARRQQLRDRNSDSVDTLVRITRKGHAEINRMLNRRVGLKRISEATERQLEARLREAERWIQSPVGR